MAKLALLFATIVGLVAGGDGGGETKSTPEPKVEPKPEPVKEYYTVYQDKPYPVTETKWEEKPYPVTQTVTYTEPQPYPVTDYETEYSSYPVTATIYVTITEVSVSNPAPVINTETDYLTETSVVVQEPVTVTTLSISETEVTVFITTTSVPAPVEVTTTELTTTAITTPYCEFCKIEFTATELVFPYVYVTTTVFATTYDIYTTIYGPNDTSYSTSTIFAQTTCTETPVTTWEYSGVALTSGTTYVAFENFTHGTLEARPDVYGCGELVSTSLDLGPAASTQFGFQIVTTPVDISETITIPAPSAIAAYLDSIPTVVAQLNGVPAGSCDTPSGEEKPAPTPTATLTATSSAAGFVARNQVPINAADVLAAGLATTSA